MNRLPASSDFSLSRSLENLGSWVSHAFSEFTSSLTGLFHSLTEMMHLLISHSTSDSSPAKATEITANATYPSLNAIQAVATLAFFQDPGQQVVTITVENHKFLAIRRKKLSLEKSTYRIVDLNTDPKTNSGSSATVSLYPVITSPGKTVAIKPFSSSEALDKELSIMNAINETVGKGLLNPIELSKDSRETTTLKKISLGRYFGVRVLAPYKHYALIMKGGKENGREFIETKLTPMDEFEAFKLVATIAGELIEQMELLITKNAVPRDIKLDNLVHFENGPENGSWKFIDRAGWETRNTVEEKHGSQRLASYEHTPNYLSLRSFLRENDANESFNSKEFIKQAQVSARRAVALCIYQMVERNSSANPLIADSDSDSDSDNETSPARTDRKSQLPALSAYLSGDAISIGHNSPFARFRTNHPKVAEKILEWFGVSEIPLDLPPS